MYRLPWSTIHVRDKERRLEMKAKGKDAEIPMHTNTKKKVKLKIRPIWYARIYESRLRNTLQQFGLIQLRTRLADTLWGSLLPLVVHLKNENIALMNIFLMSSIYSKHIAKHTNKKMKLGGGSITTIIAYSVLFVFCFYYLNMLQNKIKVRINSTLYC